MSPLDVGRGVAAVLIIGGLTAPRSEAQDTLGREGAGGPSVVSQLVYDGWKRFELDCSRCHGTSAVGSSFAPNLTQSVKPDGAVPTKAAFLEVVSNGRPDRGMPAFRPLGYGAEELEALYAYVKARSEGKVKPGRPLPRPDS